MVRRLWAPTEEAESVNDDTERLAAYHQLREMLSWLRFPLEWPDAYPEQQPKPIESQNIEPASSGGG
jgi:hypothetical protein